MIIIAIHQYIVDCCTLTYRLITFFAAQKIRRKSDLGLAHLVGLEYHTTLLKNNLVISILERFQRYQKTKRVNALSILAQDDKFMKLADNLHKDFDRGFDIAWDMRLGKRS